MSMFDWYLPRRALRCPVCDVALAHWQGKDGPRELLVWQQGERAPVDQRVDADKRASDLGVFQLPPEFEIQSADCRHLVTARGVCIDGTWQRTWLDVKAAMRHAVRAVYPPWWTWKVTVAPDADVDAFTAQVLLGSAAEYREDAVEGRYVIETHRGGEPWELVVEPDDTTRTLRVISAEPVD